MSWFKVDDGLPMSRKVLAISRRRRMAAMGLWCVAGAWSARELTDGFIPASMPEELGAAAKDVHDLVTAGLWDVVDGGWKYHDWADYQPSREHVLAERKEHADRQKAYRERKKAERDAARLHNASVTRDARVQPALPERAESVQGARPDPTRPDPTVVPTELPSEELSTKRNIYPADFSAFWDEYPKKVGKDAAVKVWKAAKQRATVEEIVAGAKRYAANPKRDPQYTKDPVRWLTGGHWADEPEAQKVDPYRAMRMLG